MKKIVELIVKLDELELEDVGVDAVALVENPAIELPFMAFATEQEFVQPLPTESEDEFISRCIPTVIGEGYDQDQASAICYSYWEEGFEQAEAEKLTAEAEEHLLKCTEELGEAYDPETVVYIDGTKERFSDLTDILKAITALDILGKPQMAREGAQTKYRYTGPLTSRPFCRALMSKNKLFSRKEIDEMFGFNSQMGPNSNAGYSKFLYAGGPNCRHYWEELTVFRNEQGQLIFLSHGPATQPNSDKPLKGYRSAASQERSREGYLKWYHSRFSFSVVDEEQKVVIGPVLVPNKLIRRIDKKTGEEYFVYFSEKTIKDVAEMMFKRNLQNNTNVEHDSFDTDTNNTLLESWIVADPVHDKAKALGFDVPKGTLMQARRINDEETWNMVKEGRLRGFSVEGMFLEKAQEQEPAGDDQLLSSIMNILKSIK